MDGREKGADEGEECINLVDDEATEESGIAADEQDGDVDHDGIVEEDAIDGVEEMA